MTSPKTVLSSPDRTSFLAELAVGRLRWDLIHPFPAEDEPARKQGDEAVAELSGFLREHVDPEWIDRSGRLPDQLLPELRQDGWLALTTAPELAGRGLSRYGAFRAIHTAASWSVPVAQVMAVQAAIGVGALLPAVADSPLRELLRSRVSLGVVSGSADTEAAGAANQGRDTTATPTEDGAAFLLNGEKIHIGNGPVAQTLIVSATVREAGAATRRLFVVDTDSPGFQVRSRHEFMGLRGFPIAALGFTDVRVPREQMLVERDDRDTRLTPRLVELVVTGRMYLIAAPSLAIARRCVEWTREFAGRRVVDSRPLAGYEYIQREIAESLADTYSVETVARWCLHDGPVGRSGQRVNPLPEQMVAKNIASVTCWRVLERTMSLLAGEGFETATSKAVRGAAPAPLERAYRDARGFRISGGVDFLLDYWAAQVFVLPHYYPEPESAAEIEAGPPDLSWCAETPLTPRNQDHLAEVGRQAHRYAQTLLRMSRAQPQAELAAEQQRLILLSQVLNELMTSALVLARAASSGTQECQQLADTACAAARSRLADHWRRLAPAAPADHAELTERWLRGGFEFLGDDLVPADHAAPTADHAATTGGRAAPTGAAAGQDRTA